MYNFKNTSFLTLSLFPFTVSHVWIVWACDSLCVCWYLYHRVIWTEPLSGPGRGLRMDASVSRVRARLLLASAVVFTQTAATQR